MRGTLITTCHFDGVSAITQKNSGVRGCTLYPRALKVPFFCGKVLVPCVILTVDGYNDFVM